MTPEEPRQRMFPNLHKAQELAAERITDQVVECDQCGLWRPLVGALADTPAEALREAVRSATAALDAAKADGFVIPPQAAPAIAMLDLTARMLAVQPSDDTPEKAVITP